MITRRALGGLAAAVAAVGIAGCTDQPDDGKVHIRFRYLWTGIEARVVERIIDRFNRSQRRIVVEGISNPDQQSQLAAMSSGNSSFDVSDSFGINTGTWASRGVFEPLDPYLRRDGLESDAFVPATMTQCRFEGDTYALPLAAHSRLLVYNTELLERAGLSGPPRTIGELADAIDKLTVVKNGRIEQLGFGSPTGTGADFITLAMAFGGSWYNDSGEPTPDNPRNVLALAFYVDTITKKYGVDEISRFTAGFGDYQSPQNPFFQGKLAMAIDTEVISRFTKEFAPKLPWDVAPLPYPDERPDLQGTTQVETSTVFITRNSNYKQEAWEFLRYLVSESSMAEFTQELGNLPTRTSLLRDPRYDSLPHFRAFADASAAPNAASLPSSMTLVQYMADLTNAFDQATRGRQTPQQALRYVAERVESYDDFY